jgi:hypothetical protein
MSAKTGKRVASVGVVAAAVAAALVGTTGSAFAVSRPTGAEACPANSFCLYFNSPQYGWGSFEHWSPPSDYNLGDATFGNWGNGSGYGVTVGGHAAAAVNNTGHTVAIYNDINCHAKQSGGAVEYFDPNDFGQLAPGLYNAAWSFCGD